MNARTLILRELGMISAEQAEIEEAIFRWLEACWREQPWFSAGGGTANVAAGILSRHYAISFEEARESISRVGRRWNGEWWYATLCRRGQWTWEVDAEEEDGVYIPDAIEILRDLLED